jgi:hypothetical protein
MLCYALHPRSKGTASSLKLLPLAPPAPPSLQWPDPTPPQDIPPWLRWGRADLLEAMQTTKHKPDVAAEMAALTGTVLHHHRPAAARGAAPRRGAAAGRPPGRPQVPAAEALAALAARRAAAAAAPAAEAWPEPTVTTTRSSLGAAPFVLSNFLLGVLTVSAGLGPGTLPCAAALCCAVLC